MKGLLIWGQSPCRSMLAFYEGIAKAFNVPMRVLFWRRAIGRKQVGHDTNELQHVSSQFIGNDFNIALQEYEAHKDWHQLFGSYQKNSIFRKFIVRAKKDGCAVGIASEAPCVMVPPPRSMIWNWYQSFFLRYIVKNQIQSSDFILNLSGDDSSKLLKIGWLPNKIIGCGYYSAPLVGSVFHERTVKNWHQFTVLMTGVLQYHRNPMLLLQALDVLRNRGIRVKTWITQNGPLLKEMKKFALKQKLDVDFLGFVQYPKLLELYQNCSCFVATGRSEPWGMRVNDALHCGAPLALSRGMGAIKMINEHQCGYVFRNDDAMDLANKLEVLIINKNTYLKIANHVKMASMSCLPDTMSLKIAHEICRRYKNWA